MSPKSKRVLSAGFAALLVVGAFASVELHRFFDRPGESALSTVPGSATIVAVADLQPGPKQLSAFRKLSSDADSAELGKNLDHVFDQYFADRAWAKSILPHLRHSGVVASLPSREGGGGDSSVLILPISDVAAVKSVLSGGLKSSPDGLGFEDEKSGYKVAIVRDEIVVSADQSSIDSVRSCAEGKSASIAENAQYKDARSRIDYDANLMVFVSNPMHLVSPSASGPSGWFAGGLAIRDAGLSLSCNIPVNTTAWEGYKDLASMKPIRRDLLAHLPAGAYDVGAISQPGEFLNLAEHSALSTAGGDRQVLDLEKSFRTSTAIDFRSEAIPSLMGTAVYASYPSRTQTGIGMNCLAILDDANSARPADLADRLREYVEKLFADKLAKGPLFARLDAGPSEAYTLSPAVREAWMAKATPVERSRIRQVVDDQTMCFALVGGAVIFSTSNELLSRAVDAYQGRGALLSRDAAFLAQPPFGADGSQFTYVADVPRIVEAAANNSRMKALTPSDQAVAKDALATFSQVNDPLSFSVKAAPNAASAKVFIPMDYQKLSQFFNQQKSLIEKFTAEQPKDSGL